MIFTIKTTIDRAGRLVVPKAIRDQAGLKPGILLDVSLRGAVLEITPSPQPVKITKHKSIAVAQRVAPVKNTPLTQETVSETIEAMRNRRA